MKKLTGNVSFGFYTGNTESGVRIQIGDEEAGVRLCTVCLTYEQFGQLCGSRWLTDVPVEYNDDADRVGKRLETKTEHIPFDMPRSDRGFDKAVDKVLLSYEIDGWEARRDDFKNWHRREGNKTTVIFQRWVDNVVDNVGEESKAA